MRYETLGLALVSVLLSALSQVALKAGMTSLPVQVAIASASTSRIVVAVSRSWLVVGGLLCFGLSALVWLKVLSRVPLSTAYPMVALGIAVTTVAGLLLFNEPIATMKLAGVVLILCGVICVSLSF